jgi:hypothetical protein
MFECFTFEHGFTCNFVGKTTKKRCFKKATNKEQTYCNTHNRYGDPTKKISPEEGKPCMYKLKRVTRNGKSECGKISKERTPGMYYCDGHSKVLKNEEKHQGKELKLGSIPKVPLDPSVPIDTKSNGKTMIKSSTYET